MPKMRLTTNTVSLASLCLLTLLVVFYDIRVLIPPKVLYIKNYGYGESEDGKLSWTLLGEELEPRIVVNITDHPLKERIMHYVNESISRGHTALDLFVGDRVYVVDDPGAEDFFGQYHVSSWCLNCALEMSPFFVNGNIFYHVLVSSKNLRPNHLEYGVAWTVSLATMVLWGLQYHQLRKRMHTRLV